MELATQLTTAARQLEALITTHWEALPAQLGHDLTLLAERMDRWAEQATGLPGALALDAHAPSAKLAHIDRELVALGRADTVSAGPRYSPDNFARQIADVQAVVVAMEERLRPPTARELSGNVVPLRRRLRGLTAVDGDVA